MDTNVLLIGLGLCGVTAIVGSYVAVRIEKAKLDAVSFLGFLASSAFVGYLLSLCIYAMARSGFYGTTIACGLVYPWIFIKSWLHIVGSRKA